MVHLQVVKLGLLEIRVGGFLDALEESACGGEVGNARHSARGVSDGSQQRTLATDEKAGRRTQRRRGITYWLRIRNQWACDTLSLSFVMDTTRNGKAGWIGPKKRKGRESRLHSGPRVGSTPTKLTWAGQKGRRKGFLFR